MGITQPCLCLIVLTSLTWADMMPSFVKEPESTVISQNAPVTLHCQVSPSSASVRWLFNSKQLDPRTHNGINMQGTNLHIKNAEDTKTGVYQCIATTSAGSIISKPAVLKKPVLNKFQDTVDLKINATTGGVVVLPCQPPSSYPPAKIVFQKESGEVVNTDSKDTYHKLPSGNILIENVQPADSGRYQCVAVNPASGQKHTASHFIYLSVSDQSQGERTEIVDTEATSIQQQKSQDVTLECPTSSFPKPRVVWTKYGGQLNFTRMRQEHGNLHIRNVQIEDAGTYLCLGTNTTVTKLVSLQVTEPPAVHALKSLIVKSAGEGLQLHCSVQGRPEPHLVWFFNARKVQTGADTFLLEKVAPSHQGIYQCVATNDAGVAHATISVEVTGQGLDPSGKSDDVVTGVTETDLAASNNETTEDVAFTSRKPKRKRKKNHNSRRKAKQRRRGKKKKKHRNSDRKRADEKVKLVPPSRPTVTQLSETSIMLNWTVPENDGLAITFFRVQYKEIAPVKSQWRTEDVEIGKYIRRYEVSRLKPGGTYKFRIAAVYSNNDNKVGHNSVRFTLQVAPRKEPSPPVDKPRIVEAKPIEYYDQDLDKTVYAIGVKWRYLPVDSSPIEGFYIYYKPYHSQEDDKQIPIIGAGIRQHIIDRLIPDTEYSIRMQCFNSAGTSDYSTTVVQRTQSSGSQKRPNFPLLPTPQPDNNVPDSNTRKPDSYKPDSSHRDSDSDNEPVAGKTDTQLSSETLYLALGIVLAFLFVVLIVFMIMCWWRQRKQRALLAMSGVVHTTKFQDQAQRIYSESMRKKYMNGYPLNGLNGLVGNGHLPQSQHNKMNINVNPLSEMETAATDPGKPYSHHMMANGMVPSYSVYQNNNDNNSNTINTGKTDTDRLTPNQNCIDGSVGDYPAHPGGNPSTFHSFSPQPYSANDDDIAGCELNCRVSPKYHLPVRYVETYLSEEQLAHDDSDRCDSRHMYGAHHSMDNLSPSSVPGNQVKHKRRRKRPQSREHTTKDQATNTDLSSNEGTVEFTTFNKSSVTNSDGSRTFINNGTQCSDVLHTNVDL